MGNFTKYSKVVLTFVQITHYTDKSSYYEYKASEDLPTPAESIQQLQQKELKRLAQGPQLSLFEETAGSDSTYSRDSRH